MGAHSRSHFGWLTLSLVLASLSVPFSSVAQITFERTYGGIDLDAGYSVQQTQDGGHIVAGRTESFGMGLSDVYLIKTDSLGDSVWTRTYGGIGWDVGESVQQTQDGGYIITGCTESFGVVSRDVCLIRVDSLGNSMWTRTYGGGDTEMGYSVQQTQDGGYIIVGLKWSLGYDTYLVKTDSAGDSMWTRTYGGIDLDAGYSVQQTQDGGYIIAGTYSFGSGYGDVYLIKTDSLGDSVWTRTYGGGSGDWGRSVQQTEDGGYIIAGYTESFGAGSCDVYLIKTDSAGDSMWTRTYGGVGYDRGYSVQPTSDGGYVVAGLTESFGQGLRDVYLMKADSLGESLWTRTFGGSGIDEARSVCQTPDGGYVLAGVTTSFGSGNFDVYLIKTDENGLTGIEEIGTRSAVCYRLFQLRQNRPNPFHRSTVISYSLPAATQVTLAIYDISGRLVETLVSEIQQPDIHQVHWSRKSNPSGVYFYRLEAGEFVEARKMVVID